MLLSFVLALQPIASRAQGSMAGGLSPDHVQAMLDRLGPAAATRALSDREWRQIQDGISLGDPKWLALAPRLAGTGNAGAGEGLIIAISDALQRNPAAVLALSGRQFPIARICRDNAIEPTAQARLAFYAATIPAVRSVRAPWLRARRDACLANLQR
jgi:hypothetical protein